MRMILAILLLLVCMLLACSLFTHQQDRSEAVPASTGSTSARVPAVTGTTSAPPLYFGDTSVEERISTSAAVVKARLERTTTYVFTSSAEGWGGKYYVAIKFHLTVSEYLIGSGTNNITAVWVLLSKFNTQREAEDAAPGITAKRDTTWDDRDAVFFLRNEDPNLIFSTSVLGNDEYFLTTGGNIEGEDRYSLSSRFDRRWLPSAGTTATGDNQEFLLAVPNPTLQTVTLGELKRRVTSVNAELNGGDGSKAYKDCIRGKYSYERHLGSERSKGRGNWYVPRPQGVFVSGQSAGTELYEYDEGWAQPADKKARLWLDGQDTALFGVKLGDLRTGPDRDRDGQSDGFVFDQRVVSARPIPEGSYRFNNHFIPWGFLACGYTLTHEVAVNVTAPAGVLHELFFDPVTAAQGQSGPAKVAADASNGVLEPASFTDANGASATIQSVSYEPPSGGSGQSGADSESGTGTVAMKLTTHTGLANHALDFIALDGSVSLSLVADDATVDDANNTLSWTVTEQPWHGGDKLMLRIRKALSAPEDVSVSLSGGTYTISWSAVTGAADYRAQYRTGGSEAEWTDLDATTGTSQTFSPEGGVACSTTYEFRVQARGDGTTYPAEWSKLSESISHTNSAGKCNRARRYSASSDLQPSRSLRMRQCGLNRTSWEPCQRPILTRETSSRTT